MTEAKLDANSWTEKGDKIFGTWLEKTPSLEGKNIAITGTTSGTGFYTAIFAIRKNARLVILLNRKSAKNDEAVKLLIEEKQKVGSFTEIQFVPCDLMSFDAVKEAAEEVSKVCEQFGSTLNVLINNAGIMAFPDDRTIDGYDVQMQTNHLSHYLLTKLLWPLLEKTYEQGEEVRVVQHSSGARQGFSRNFLLDEKFYRKSEANTLGGNSFFARFGRYAQTKLSNVAFALMLHKKLEEKGYDTSRFKSTVAEPGASETSLSTHTKGSLSFGSFMSSCLMAMISNIVPHQSAADGAIPLIEASFGEHVDSGDFFYPENIFRGKPLKGINKGALTEEGAKKNKEIAPLNEKNQELVWKVSEEEVGQLFTK